MNEKTTLVLAAVYDTETCNVGKGRATRAYPILFIDHDIRDVDIYNYEPLESDKINLYRYEHEMLARIDDYILWGEVCGVVPIICAYNLMFDLQPLMEELNAKYEIRANAQSSTNLYTLDLYCGGKQVLRFWDTFHLENRGLAAMGKTCGIKKAVGDWDYSLIRTPETPLTTDEIFYAKRDTQVIPAYLSYLLHANEWMQQSDFGFRVLTKTSIVRQMARREIGPLEIPKKNGKPLKLDFVYRAQCKRQIASCYDIYGLRKACFRGGFTFTAARYALTLQTNVVSVDVKSMHHTFLNGRYLPQDFKPKTPAALAVVVNSVLDTTFEHVLENYHKPFEFAFHAKIKFTNIRLRKGTCFSYWGIALAATSKFKKEIDINEDMNSDPRGVAQENSLRANGYVDTFNYGTFAFGKMYDADTVIMHLNELELWAMGRVYEWDKIEVLFGEATKYFKIPPDYVTLQSNKLYGQKSAASTISKNYMQGLPYMGDVEYMPDGIAETLRDGTLEKQFFDAWYSCTAKGMFNGIYGTQAQDEFKPMYKCENGELSIDQSTVTTRENFDERKPKNPKVLYTYGMRIVGGSRMHMVIACELIWNYFGKRVRILGGDTDSMKMSCNADVTNDEISFALQPIADASKRAIDSTCKRIREEFPQMASTLDGVGGFEIENANKHYPLHYECWNKTRVSFDGKNTHITAAGLPRPIGLYTIESFMDELIASGYKPEEVIQETVGFNRCIFNNVSHTLEHHKPKSTDIFDETITDYRGVSIRVSAHESSALYAAPHWLGETLKPSNLLTVEYLQRKYGRDIDTDIRYIKRDELSGVAQLYKETSTGTRLIMEGRNGKF